MKQLMEQLTFKNIEEFVNKVDDNFNKLLESSNDYDCPTINIVAKYEDTRQIIKELLWIDYNLRSIESLDAPDFCNYFDEYIISITNIDEDYETWCEPMKNENGYILAEGNTIYILDNCSSKVISHLCSKAVYEVNISDDNKETENEDINEKTDNREKSTECTIKSDDGKSIYHISVNGNLDKGETQKIINDMERGIQHMYDMVDEMNNFRKLFTW